MNDFQTDLKYSLDERENEVFDRFYHRIFPGIKSIESVVDIAMQKKGVDKILHFVSGKSITIDEKKRRKDYGDILLEIWSVWEQKKRGWLYTCQCDYIVYAIMPAKTVYLLPALLLKKTWLVNRQVWIETYPVLDAKNIGYVTKTIAIPTNVLLCAISAEMRQDF